MRMTKIRILLLLGSFVFLSFASYALVVAKPEEPAEPAAAPAWENVINISTGDSGARLPSVAGAANGKDVIVAYVSQRSATAGDTDPYYRVSSNNGATFPSNPAAINTNAATETIDVAVAYDANSRAHALWIEENADNDRELRYARENNWPSSSTLRASVTNPGVIFTPRIVTSGSNTVDIVWAEGANIIADIYHARSTNGGSSWTISGVITDTADLSQFPDLAVGSNGTIHVVWSEGLLTSKVNYVQGTVSGGSVSWSSAIQISNQSGATNALEPSIFVKGSVVQVSYTDRLGEDSQFVHYLRCANNCTNVNNWVSSGNPVSGQAVGANVGDPFDVSSTLVQVGGCSYVYFHGVRTGSNEQILGVDSCGRWASSARDQVTATNIRALNPDLAVQNNWWIYLVYENKSNERIQFLRNLPAIYLPVVVK
jgi:hypothetical protein